MIAINGRFRGRRTTGVERYAQEICKHLTVPFRFAEPAKPLSGLKGHLWEQMLLPSLAQNDLLWCPCNTGPVVKQKQVVTIHDVAVLDHPEWFSPRFAEIYAWILPRLAKRARHIFTGSEFSKQTLCRALRVSENKVTVIPNGVGAGFKIHPEAKVLQVKERLGVMSPRYLLTVGSLEPRKNLPGLLSAWKEVAPQLPDVVLVVIGAASKHIFRGEAGEAVQDQVLYLGYTSDEDLSILYSGAECVIYPSLYEGFGLPALEALACGARVITSAGTAMEEFAGPGCIFVDPRSTGELQSAIQQVLGGPRFSSPSNAAHYRDKYSWERSAAQVSALLLSHS